MKPTYDQLFETVRVLSQANFNLQEDNKRLQKQIKILEERLNLNSKNSSKPPSTDKKKNKKSPRGGAKPGHPGAHRKDHVDKTIRMSVDTCEKCGSQDLEKKTPLITRQPELTDIKPAERLMKQKNYYS